MSAPKCKRGRESSGGFPSSPDRSTRWNNVDLSRLVAILVGRAVYVEASLAETANLFEQNSNRHLG